MSEFLKLMDLYCEDISKNVHTAIIGKISKLAGGRAEVEPQHDGYPLLINVPMLRQHYSYAVGNLVLVIFVERALDGAGERIHSLDDAVIVGVLM